MLTVADDILAGKTKAENSPVMAGRDQIVFSWPFNGAKRKLIAVVNDGVFVLSLHYL